MKYIQQIQLICKFRSLLLKRFLIAHYCSKPFNPGFTRSAGKNETWLTASVVHKAVGEGPVFGLVAAGQQTTGQYIPRYAPSPTRHTVKETMVMAN